MAVAFIERDQNNAFAEPAMRSLMKFALPSRSFGANAEIVEENAPASLALVTDGWAVRSRFLADGRRQLMALFVSGDLCNLDCLFSSKNAFSVTALTTCTAAVLPIEFVRKIARENLEVRNLLWRLMIASNALSTEWLLSLGRRSTRERLAHLFLELHARLSLVSVVEEYSFTLPLTQRDFGDILGVSSVHINRILQSFRSEGLVSFNGRRVSILDVAKLQAVAEFNPRYLRIS
jgi:CRP-like cAMP-binding protein